MERRKRVRTIDPSIHVSKNRRGLVEIFEQSEVSFRCCYDPFDVMLSQHMHRSAAADTESSDINDSALIETIKEELHGILREEVCQPSAISAPLVNFLPNSFQRQRTFVHEFDLFVKSDCDVPLV